MTARLFQSIPDGTRVPGLHVHNVIQMLQIILILPALAVMSITNHQWTVSIPDVQDIHIPAQPASTAIRQAKQTK
jgi:energy-converting hydrogenase Eha subunit H